MIATFSSSVGAATTASSKAGNRLRVVVLTRVEIGFEDQCLNVARIDR